MRNIWCTSWALTLALGTTAWGANPAKLVSQLPLRFEQSKTTDANFAAHSGAYDLALRPTETRIDTHRGVVTMSLGGANSHAHMEALDRLPGVANYFLKSQDNWQTNVVGYARVRSSNVYPGVDLVFHGENGRLEYDFIVAPNADPRAIRMSYRGNRGLKIDESGDLVVATHGAANDEMRWHKPELYQDIDGVRRSIAGNFAIRRNEVIFEIGAYDRSHTLVIDPTLAYVTYLGGLNNEVGRGIGVDGAGNVYIAGVTGSAGLPTVSAAQPNFGGSGVLNPFGDAFVAKFNPAGVLQYLTYVGGSGNDAALALAVDSAGNAYIAGCTTSTNFPLVNPTQSKFGGQGSASIVLTGDAFVAKLNPAGNQLLYSTYLGGSLDDIATAIAIDSAGNAYVAGATVSQNFPTSAGAFQRTMKGASGEPIRPNAGQPAWEPGDAFVVKLNAAGQMTNGTMFGGTQDDAALTVAVDSAGNVYIGGSTLSPDLQTTAGAMQRSYGGADIIDNNFFNTGDGFIAKLDPTLATLLYGTYFGGRGDDTVASIAVDGSGNIYFTGSTSTSNLNVTSGVFQGRYVGFPNFFNTLIEQLYGDAYVAKINPSQTTPIYLSYLGGSGNDGGTAIAVDSAGNAYVTGFTDSTDFPMAGSPLQSTFGGDGGQGMYILYGDAFLAVVNPAGTQLLYSSYYGGNMDDEGDGIAIDGSGNVYITGNTLSNNLQTPIGAFQKSFGGVGGNLGLIAARGDAFYAKFSGFTNSGGGGGGTPVLSLSSTTANFTYTIGGVAPAPGTITISNTGSGTLQWFATSSNPSAFTVSASGAAAAGASSQLNIIPLVPSNPTPNTTITATITVTAPGAGNAPQTINVSLVISGSGSGGGSPVLSVPTAPLTFNYTIGGTPPAPTTINVTNTGTGTLNWNASVTNLSSFPNLFSVTSSGSSGAGASSPLTISVNLPSNLTPNTYRGTVTVSASGAALPDVRGAALTSRATAAVSAFTVALVVSSASTGGGGTCGTNSILPGLTHFAAQDVWTLGIFVVNKASTPANFSAAFCDDNGQPLTLQFSGGATTKLSANIPANGSAYFETLNPPGAQLVSGWAQINADPSIAVQALFRENSSGTYYEAAVPSNSGANEFKIPFDASTFAPTGDPLYTGFAIANLDPAHQATVSCTALDSNGVAIPNAFAGVGPPTLQPLGHWAGYLFPALSGKRGTIDCVSNTTIAGLALRFIGSNAFSSLPVINNPAGLNSNGTGAISHFAAQDVWTSGFFIVNTLQFAENYSIAFFDDNGNPLKVPFATGATNTLTGNVPAYGMSYIETTNAGAPLIAGWGQITAGNGIAIQALFRENSGGTYYEAAVPNSAALTEFEIPFDDTTFAPTGDQLYTGFALANLSQSIATINCTARDQTGTVIPGAFNGQTGPPQLSAMGHWAGYLFQALAGKRGTIDCTSNVPVGATALRFIGTNAFSTLVVIPK